MTRSKSAPVKTVRPSAKTPAKAVKTPAKAVKSVAKAVKSVEPVIAPTPAAAAAPEVVVATPVAWEEFQSIVRAEALGLAQARAFRDGNMLGDWLRAEAAVLTRLAAAGRAVAPPSSR